MNVVRLKFTTRKKTVTKLARRAFLLRCSVTEEPVLSCLAGLLCLSTLCLGLVVVEEEEGRTTLLAGSGSTVRNYKLVLIL